MSPKKVFQKAVWELHLTGVPLKEAENFVAQEAFVQNKRCKRIPARDTSTQLSFPEEQGVDGSQQQGRPPDSRAYVPLVAKKARIAEVKKIIH